MNYLSNLPLYNEPDYWSIRQSYERQGFSKKRAKKATEDLLRARVAQRAAGHAPAAGNGVSAGPVNAALNAASALGLGGSAGYQDWEQRRQQLQQQQQAQHQAQAQAQAQLRAQVMQAQMQQAEAELHNEVGEEVEVGALQRRVPERPLRLGQT